MSAACGIELTLRGPFKDKDATWHLRKWGASACWDWGALPGAVHHRDGGLHTFHLPSVPTVLAYARKAAKHPHGATALGLLSIVVPFAHTDLRDAIWLQRWLLAHDPHATDPGRLMEWRDVGVLSVDVLQARWPGGLGLADPPAAVAELRGLRDDLARLELGIVERQYAAARAALAGRAVA